MIRRTLSRIAPAVIQSGRPPRMPKVQLVAIATGWYDPAWLAIDQHSVGSWRGPQVGHDARRSRPPRSASGCRPDHGRPRRPEDVRLVEGAGVVWLDRGHGPDGVS